MSETQIESVETRVNQRYGGSNTVETFTQGLGLSSKPIIITDVKPELDDGRFAVKREIGDILVVQATIFKEGHDRLIATLLWKRYNEADWYRVPMTLSNPGLDLYEGQLLLEDNTYYVYTIEVMIDVWGSWCNDIQKKRSAQQDITLELIEGGLLIKEAVEKATDLDKKYLSNILKLLESSKDVEEQYSLLFSSDIGRVIKQWSGQDSVCRYDRVLELFVDRKIACYAAWYEMFHRSQGTTIGKGATFVDCERRLSEIHDLGFDVVYLVPIHPIGKTNRKGPNNSLVASSNDPGSPYAIGSDTGGHTDIHPELGTIEDFRHFVQTVSEYGMEVALDFAIQCSPDHPWIKKYSRWFRFRPDGSIRYAENPPKKYQDIVNVDFHNTDAFSLWQALLEVVLYWVKEGVKIFRVDNPHTKPLPFWEWIIKQVHLIHPEVIFLSEAFTRPPMMTMLAKVGFSQSYTYFTWRNFKWELTEYFSELTQTNVSEYMRPNLFPSTPDILPEFLQKGGRPAFMIRFILAATLSPLYGIYNGFELCENSALPGKEEYLNSEKYSYKVWDWERSGNIKSLIARVNRIRKDNIALHKLTNLRFHNAYDDNVIFYSKMTRDHSNMLFIIVNLDPFDRHECSIEIPLDEINVKEHETYAVEELISGTKHLWSGASHHVSLDPHTTPALILRVVPWRHVDFVNQCW